MLALVTTLFLGSPALGGAADPCAGTLDRTAECVSPRKVPLVVTNDTKPAPEAPARDPSKIPGELGFMGMAVAIVGSGALASTLFEWNGVQQDDQRTAKLAVAFGGGGMLVASGAIFATAGAFWVFDPSTGKMRFTIEGE